MKNFEFKTVGSFKHGDKFITVKEYQHGDYFQIGKCRIPAKTFDGAVAKWKEWQARRLKIDCAAAIVSKHEGITCNVGTPTF